MHGTAGLDLLSQKAAARFSTGLRTAPHPQPGAVPGPAAPAEAPPRTRSPARVVWETGPGDDSVEAGRFISPS